jgi:hypothetical protein
MKPLKLLLLLAVLLETSGGCASVFHDLKPHRLRRLNRGPAPQLDPEFSAIDKKPAETVLANSGVAVTVRAQQ